MKELINTKFELTKETIQNGIDAIYTEYENGFLYAKEAASIGKFFETFGKELVNRFKEDTINVVELSNKDEKVYRGVGFDVKNRREYDFTTSDVYNSLLSEKQDIERRIKEFTDFAKNVKRVSTWTDEDGIEHIINPPIVEIKPVLNISIPKK